MQPDFLRNAAFHSHLAPHYDTHLAIDPYNALARDAFLALVNRYVPSGQSILDFGCGTGIDAQHYAQSGYRVYAYDNSPGMVAQLKDRCPAAIDAGQITAWSEDYPSFLSNFHPPEAPSAATADFAVLNSIQDLKPLFATFAKTLAPPGWVIVSVLNPLHWQRWKSVRWWTAALPLRRVPPPYTFQPYTAYLHFTRSLLRAAPQFRLIGRANSGKHVRYCELATNQVTWRSHTANPGIERILWKTPAHPMLGHFVFLVLRRDP